MSDTETRVEAEQVEIASVEQTESADQVEKPTGGEGEAGSGSNRFQLPSQADIRMAAKIHSQCTAALDATGDVQIDCGSVERVDASVLQCIGSLANSLRESSRGLELVNRTEPLDNAIGLLGFDELLNGS